MSVHSQALKYRAANEFHSGVENYTAHLYCSPQLHVWVGGEREREREREKGGERGEETKLN